MSAVLAALIALSCCTEPALAASHRMLARRPLVYMTFVRRPDHGNAAVTCTWHVVWCRFRRGARVYTAAVPPAERRYRYAPHWAYETTRPGEYRAMINGAVYNQAVVPSLPIGGVGQGSKGWTLGCEATNPKFCFGMTADGRKTKSGLPPFALREMVVAYARRGTNVDNEGRMVSFYTVAPEIRHNYPYGFGCVGALVKPGGWPVWNALRGGWQNGESLGPSARLARTAVAWTRDGDLFFVTCTNPKAGADPSKTGATWSETVDFVVNYLPAGMKHDYPYMIKRRVHKKIDGAVMLDGGGSTMLGYKHITHAGNVDIDHDAPHGPHGYRDVLPLIPDFIYAIGRNRE
ncbi:MAG TPA: phosphodiester glycosidase family protein [Capsulimonadaceae bacterium]